MPCKAPLHSRNSTGSKVNGSHFTLDCQEPHSAVSHTGGKNFESRGFCTSGAGTLTVRLTRLAELVLNAHLLVFSLCVLARKHCARLLGEVGGAVLGENETLGLCMPSTPSVPGPCIHSRFSLRHDMKAWDRALRLCVCGRANGRCQPPWHAVILSQPQLLADCHAHAFTHTHTRAHTHTRTHTHTHTPTT